MTDLTRYRIDLLTPKLSEDDFLVAQDMDDWLTERGVLVLDSTLSDIADAWDSGNLGFREMIRKYMPELAALLDALEGTTNE